jgi:hypothetical protein
MVWAVGRRPRTTQEKLRALAERQPDFRDRFSDAKLAERFGVSRQLIHQILGPYGGPRRRPQAPPTKPPKKAPGRRPPKRPKRAGSKPSPDRPCVDPETAAARLRARVVSDPGYPDRYTYPEIAAQFGISSQRVLQILGPTGRGRHDVRSARLKDRLRAFVAQHPSAALPLCEGGMTARAIGEATGLSRSFVLKTWKELGLPSRAQVLRGPHHVLRQEACVECGRSFDWTVQRDRNFRRGVQNFVVCSISCGRHHGRKRRPSIAPKGWLTVPQAVGRCGLSGDQIRNLAAAGSLKAHRHGRFWLIHERSLGQVKRRRGRKA